MAATIVGDEDFELWVLLNHVVHAMGRLRENELRKSGVSMMQAKVLFILKTIKVPATPAEISRWMFRMLRIASSRCDAVFSPAFLGPAPGHQDGAFPPRGRGLLR